MLGGAEFGVWRTCFGIYFGAKRCHNREDLYDSDNPADGPRKSSRKLYHVSKRKFAFKLRSFIMHVCGVLTVQWLIGVIIHARLFLFLKSFDHGGVHIQ